MKTKKMFLSLLIAAAVAFLIDVAFLCCLVIFASEVWRLATFSVVVVVVNAVVILFAAVYVLVRLRFQKEF